MIIKNSGVAEAYMVIWKINPWIELKSSIERDHDLYLCLVLRFTIYYIPVKPMIQILQVVALL